MHDKIKVMIVGDYSWPWYQEACANALETLGCQVIRFGWFDDFSKRTHDSPLPVFYSIWHRLQYRLGTGPVVWRITRRLLQLAKYTQPDIVLFYNVTLLGSVVVQRLKGALAQSLLCQYANDNPFSPYASTGLWKRYIQSIPFFDAHFTYRSSNADDYYRLGAKHVRLLRSYFLPTEDYPVVRDEVPDHFKSDVVFVGHYEDDRRLAQLEHIARAGFDLKVFGSGWGDSFKKLDADSPLRSLYPITPVLGDDYRYAICGAHVALCFLSKLNQDTYTRRNFQIPAMKVAMLSEYTTDLAQLFLPNEEACYFNDDKELLHSIYYLLSNDSDRVKISRAGYERVYEDGHDVVGRMKSWLADATEIYKLVYD